MKITLTRLRRIIRETIEDFTEEPTAQPAKDPVAEELGELEVGDMVDVMGGETDYQGVRVLEIVPNVRYAVGMHEKDWDPHLGSFQGAGFVGETDHGEELVFSLEQVVPGSKARYYFAQDDDPMVHNYRDQAAQEAWESTRKR